MEANVVKLASLALSVYKINHEKEEQLDITRFALRRVVFFFLSVFRFIPDSWIKKYTVEEWYKRIVPLAKTEIERGDFRGSQSRFVEMYRMQ
jgi:hypothetical protein